MPVFGRRPGCPDPLPFDTVHRSPDVRGHCGPRIGEPISVSQPSTRSIGYPTSSCSGVAPGSPVAVPPRPRCPANRTPLPESRPGLPASRLRRLSTPFTLTRLPVPSDGDAAGRRRREQLGCPLGLGPVTLCPWPPVARRLGTQSEWFLAPSGPASASWTEPVIELGSPEGVRVLDPVSRPRLACAARYESYSRERETPGQGVFLNPQGYPPNFSSIPRNWSVVHLPYTTSCTALSPARRETSG